MKVHNDMVALDAVLLMCKTAKLAVVVKGHKSESWNNACEHLAKSFDGMKLRTTKKVSRET